MEKRLSFHGPEHVISGAGMASINDFKSFDLRIGTIIEVEDLGSRKPMYKLKIDVGELGIKNVAVGIKGQYAKEELLGKKVAVIANLDPKNIGDFVSEGMMLAAEDSGSIALLTIEKELKPGSRIF